MNEIKSGDSVILKNSPQRKFFKVIKTKGEKIVIEDGKITREVTRSLYRKITKLEQALR